jgi:OmpA-OmpF porin, OOP family
MLVCDGATGQAQTPSSADAPQRIDYLAFAQGAVPVSIGGAGARLGADFEAAVRITDGDPTAFAVMDRAPADANVEFVYELPSATTFERFAVPNIVETPSPTATFARLIEVLGSASGPTDGYVLLASATLQTHRTRGLATDLMVMQKRAVRWIKVRLVGGINVMRPASSFEFSEIIGNGSQEPPPLTKAFTGTWRTQANRMRLTQSGPVVSGCYDTSGDLSGTVSGNILRAVGLNRSDKTPSAFLLSVAADGSVRGVRSTNKGPFRYYTLAPAPGTTVECGAPSPPALGCGSVIHSISFAYDSADIRADSAVVLQELFNGLGKAAGKITIEGHTSSEGAEDYNDGLSQRRALAVVSDLIARGLQRSRLAAAGFGERRPIASNSDESGRAMNRRVEVRCD